MLRSECFYLRRQNLGLQKLLSATLCLPEGLQRAQQLSR